MEKVSDFKTRLEEMLLERGIKAAQLCRDSGVNKTTISQYLKGVYEPKQEQLIKIAEALEVTPQWLDGYDTTKYVSDTPDQICRISVFAIDDLETVLRSEVCDPVYKDCLYVEADDHLYPALNRGDLVLIEKSDLLSDGMAVLASFRRYYGLYICRHCSDGIELCCLNGYYPSIKINREELSELKVLGRVLQSIRKW